MAAASKARAERAAKDKADREEREAAEIAEAKRKKAEELVAKKKQAAADAAARDPGRVASRAAAERIKQAGGREKVKNVINSGNPNPLTNVWGKDDQPQR